MEVGFSAPSAPDHQSLLREPPIASMRLTVLHLDKDFELIAGVTGQRIERLDVD